MELGVIDGGAWLEEPDGAGAPGSAGRPRGAAAGIADADIVDAGGAELLGEPGAVMSLAPGPVACVPGSVEDTGTLEIEPPVICAHPGDEAARAKITPVRTVATCFMLPPCSFLSACRMSCAIRSLRERATSKHTADDVD
ncbi:MAG TPA: hypothetical protein VLL57_07870 [Candidatus Binataceae bacterium]|nr:hypothetical protein [Candidatus Binataceae bacterium]